MKNSRKIRSIQINLDGQSTYIVCMLCPEKSDIRGLILGNPDKELCMICMEKAR